MRIISLLASSTEILCALGLENMLVGRSHECDFPASISSLPVCTETKFPTTGTSGAIDKSIRRIVSQGLSVYKVREDFLRNLKPDLIVTQIQCEVCAVSEKDLKLALEQWVGRAPVVVSLNPAGLEDIWNDIRAIAKAARAEKAAETLIARLQIRIEQIASQTALVATRPRVACIEWMDPLMSAGNWMPTLVEKAGGQNLFGTAGQHSPYMKWEDLVQANPEVIVVLPCGWDIERSIKDFQVLTQKPGWQDLSAVKNKHVIVADGNQYFNRPGPRIVESLEILAEILHPKMFQFGHEGKGWRRI